MAILSAKSGSFSSSHTKESDPSVFCFPTSCSLNFYHPLIHSSHRLLPNIFLSFHCNLFALLYLLALFPVSVSVCLFSPFLFQLVCLHVFLAAIPYTFIAKPHAIFNWPSLSHTHIPPLISSESPWPHALWDTTLFTCIHFIKIYHINLLIRKLFLSVHSHSFLFFLCTFSYPSVIISSLDV